MGLRNGDSTVCRASRPALLGESLARELFQRGIGRAGARRPGLRASLSVEDVPDRVDRPHARLENLIALDYEGFVLIDTDLAQRLIYFIDFPQMSIDKLSS